MPRYQIYIEYVGTKFIGWQIQKNGQSIQGLIQQKLSKILNEKITIVGSGRTDSGVHAIEQSAHFDSKKKIKDSKKFLKSANYFLNKRLISILKIKKKQSTFHARYSAKMRSYLYVIYNRESPSSLNKERDILSVFSAFLYLFCTNSKTKSISFFIFSAFLEFSKFPSIISNER